MLAHLKSRYRSENEAKSTDLVVPSSCVTGSCSMPLKDLYPITTSRSTAATPPPPITVAMVTKPPPPISTPAPHVRLQALNFNGPLYATLLRHPQGTESNSVAISNAIRRPPPLKMIGPHHQRPAPPIDEVGDQATLLVCRQLEDSCTMLVMPHKVRHGARQLFTQAMVKYGHVFGGQTQCPALVGASIYAACKLYRYLINLPDICAQVRVTPAEVAACYELLLKTSSHQKEDIRSGGTIVID